ncbi:MAG: molybdenum ABC transporter ATP-binding protein [Beijerinckiaceae bacterium]
MIDVALKRRIGNFDLDVAFENSDGIAALFGRSGSGKSLTIGLIAGLDRPDAGHVILGSRILVDTDAGVYVSAHRRRIGLVFQDSYLFPHFSVKQNLLFGRWFAPLTERRIGFDTVIETLGIGHLLTRRPARLSGGERQRVAIGRALLSCPHLLLFDEPFAALDMQRRLEILPLIEHLRDEFAIPIVYVSHAIEEVARLAAYVVILEQGKVKAAGDPGDVLGADANASEDQRFGRSSVLTFRVGDFDAAYGLSKLQHAAGTVWLAGPAGSKGHKVRIVVNATDVTLAAEPPHQMSVRGTLAGQITAIETEGPFAIVGIGLDGEGHLYAMATRRAIDEMELSPGKRVFALIKTVALDERAVG